MFVDSRACMMRYPPPRIHLNLRRALTDWICLCFSWVYAGSMTRLLRIHSSVFSDLQLTGRSSFSQKFSAVCVRDCVYYRAQAVLSFDGSFTARGVLLSFLSSHLKSTPLMQGFQILLLWCGNSVEVLSLMCRLVYVAVFCRRALFSKFFLVIKGPGILYGLVVYASLDEHQFLGLCL